MLSISADSLVAVLFRPSIGDASMARLIADILNPRKPEALLPTTGTAPRGTRTDFCVEGLLGRSSSTPPDASAVATAHDTTGVVSPGSFSGTEEA